MVFEGQIELEQLNLGNMPCPRMDAPEVRLNNLQQLACKHSLTIMRTIVQIALNT
jgi:hypothetical protein